MVTVCPPSFTRRSTGGERRLGCFIAEEIEVGGLRHAEAETAPQRLVLKRTGVKVFGSKPLATSKTAAASSLVSAKIETQSSERQAGTTPVVLKAPLVGFDPTILLKAAGTRPDPAVSVPSENWPTGGHRDGRAGA